MYKHERKEHNTYSSIIFRDVTFEGNFCISAFVYVLHWQSSEYHKTNLGILQKLYKSVR